MNTRYLAALTTIILATGLNPPVTQAQSSQLVLNSVFNDVLVQRSPLSLSLQTATEPSPTDRGAPSDRKGAARGAVQPPVAQPETLL
jgi:hypothetical protein